VGKRQSFINQLLLPALGAFATDLPAKGTIASHSYETCSMVTSEYVTVLQLASRGLSGETLKDSLPGISQSAEGRTDALLEVARSEGLIDTYSRVNSEYARCATNVFRARGVPAPDSREARFHFCAGENKVRYEIALAAIMGAPEQEVLNQLRPQHLETGAAIYDLYRVEGELAVFDSLGAELKYCLKGQ